MLTNNTFEQEDFNSLKEMSFLIERKYVAMEEQLINLASYVKELDRRLTERENYSPIINELWAEQRLRALEAYVKEQKDFYQNLIPKPREVENNL